MKFKVWCPEMGSTLDDAREFDAFDANSAAEAWADDEDRRGADYLIVRGQDATVLVSADDGMHVECFVVSGESVPSYRARKSSNHRLS